MLLKFVSSNRFEFEKLFTRIVILFFEIRLRGGCLANHPEGFELPSLFAYFFGNKKSKKR
jgi:hypothetical protein